MLRVFLGLLLSAIAGPALAASLIVVSQQPAIGVLIDRDSIRRSGDVVHVNVYVFSSAPFTPGPPPVHWLEYDQEINCQTRQARNLVTGWFNLIGSRVPHTPEPLSAWSASPANSPFGQIEALVCRNQGAASMPPVASMQVFQARYAPAAPGATAAQAVEQLKDLAVVQQTADTAVLIDRRSIRRTGNTAGVHTYAYARPSPGAPQVYVEVDEEFDCTALRARRRVVGIRSADGNTLSEENGGFGDWQALTPVNVQVMVAVCQGQGVASFPSAGTLAAFSQRMASSQPRPAAQTQAASPPPQSRGSTAPIQAPAPLSVWIDTSSATPGVDPILVQAGTRQINGLVATVTRLMLLREPIVIQGRPVQWVEMTTEFACDTHRIRSAIRTYYDLARTFRAPPASAAFNAWADTPPGSISRTQEELACRGARGPNARDITDLDAFQRQYLASLPPPTVTAAAPPRSPAPSPAAPVQASASPTALGASPRPAGPAASWIEIEGMSPAGQVMLHDLASRRANGSVYSLRVTTLLIEPLKTEYGDVSWYEGTAELDCESHRYRLRLDTALDRDRSIQIPLRNPQQLDWRAIGSDAAPLDDAVCRNLRTAKVKAQPDLSLMRAGETQIAQAQKALAEYRANGNRNPVRAPDTQRYWIWGPRDPNFVTVIDLPSRRRLGSYAMVDQLLLSKPGIDVRGELYPWREMVMEIDCNTGRYRERSIGIANADRSRHLAMGDDLAKAWNAPANTEFIRDLTALVCRDVRGATIAAVPDLRVMQQRFAAGQPVVAASAAPAARPAPAVAPTPAAPANWVWLDGANADGQVQFLDLASRRRTGQIVSLRSTTLLRDPVGPERFQWFDETQEFDCAGHRSRSRFDAAQDRGRTTRTPAPDAEFDDWQAHPAGTLSATLENIVCRDRRDPDLLPVADLQAFQRQQAARWAAPPPQPRTPTARYYTDAFGERYFGESDGGITIFDISSRRRTGNTVSLTVNNLLSAPDQDGDQWYEDVAEYDCANHRYRTRDVAYYDPPRTRRSDLGVVEFDPWVETAPGSRQRANEEFVCRNIPHDEIKPVADLTTFLREATARLRARPR